MTDKQEKPEDQIKLEVVNQNLDDDEFDVYEPGSIDELISYLKRNFNALNESSVVRRKEAIMNIHKRLMEEQFRISSVVSQQIMLKFFKQLLKTFADKSEKCREYAIRIFKELIGRCDDMTEFLPYVFSVLTERVNCSDLEGIQHLPEVMRPPPGQKPKRMIKLIEDSEEIRMQLCDLIYDIICCACNGELVQHLDDVSNILRALAMDPCSDIQRDACKSVAAFCRNNTEMLLHFTEILGRAVLLPLISKKSKVRIAALDALGAILYCGVWKYNAFVFENLVGFRDPNSVPIKDFYEPAHNINYLASLITDPKPQVREMFLRQAGDWLCELPDRYDHHPRLIPYILSGLFDHQPEIREACYEILEDAGALEEKEKEKEYLEKKQYGVEAEWTQNGKLNELFIDESIPQRPRIGARLLVRSHVRKFWHALYKEIKDVSIESKIRASHLLKFGVIYAEDYMTQYNDQFVRNLVWHVVEKDASERIVAQNISRVFELLGRFTPPSSYMHLIISGLTGEFSKNDDYIRSTIKAFACLINGALEAVVPEIGLNDIKIKLVQDVINVIENNNILEDLSSHNFQEAGILLSNLVTMLFKQAKKRQLLDLNNKGLQIMSKLGFIITHIALFEKTFILTQPFNLETTDAIIEQLKPGKNDIHKLLNQLLSLEDNVPELLKEFFKESTEFDLSYDSHQWRQIIGQVLYLIYSFDNFEKSQQTEVLKLISQHLNALSDVIINNNNPEIADFMAKFAIFLLRSIENKVIQSQELQQQVYTEAIKIVGKAFYWLSQTKIKINQKIQLNYLTLLQECSKYCYSENNMEFFKNTMLDKENYQSFAQFLYQLPTTFRKYYKKQIQDFTSLTYRVISKFLIPVFQDKPRELEHLFVIPMKIKEYKVPEQPQQDSSFGQYVQFGKKQAEAEAAEQAAIKEEPQEEDKGEQEEEIQDKKTEQKQEEQTEEIQQEKIQEDKQQENPENPVEKKEEKVEEKEPEPIHVIPLLFRFILQRIEQLTQVVNQKLISESYESMICLVQLIPEFPLNYYRGTHYILEDYEKFMNKILKYLIDEKDRYQQEYYIKIAKQLYKKTPFNFSMEYEIAQKHRQHARLVLLTQILYDKIQ